MQGINIFLPRSSSPASSPVVSIAFYRSWYEIHLGGEKRKEEERKEGWEITIKFRRFIKLLALVNCRKQRGEWRGQEEEEEEEVWGGVERVAVARERKEGSASEGEQGMQVEKGGVFPFSLLSCTQKTFTPPHSVLHSTSTKPRSKLLRNFISLFLPLLFLRNRSHMVDTRNNERDRERGKKKETVPKYIAAFGEYNCDGNLNDGHLIFNFLFTVSGKQPASACIVIDPPGLRAKGPKFREGHFKPQTIWLHSARLFVYTAVHTRIYIRNYDGDSSYFLLPRLSCIYIYDS